jgi:hypothetical protein
MITGSARWYTVGAYLVDAVRGGLSSSVGRYGQVPGEIAWDDCTCEGMLAVSVPRVYRSEVFPAETEGPVGVRCQAPYEVAEYTVSVLRCAPQPDGQALAPGSSDLDTAAGLLLQDIAETVDALMPLLCGLKDTEVISDFMVTPAESAGPEGACVGFNLRVLVSLEV